jgi:hypothetical protein
MSAVRTTLLGLFAACALAPPARAEAPAPPLPVLRAHSRTLDVRDGEWFLRGIWICDPAAGLETYEARRSAAPKLVTFISDLDSLVLATRPGGTIDFLVVLDGRDTCRTRLSTRTLPYAGGSAGPDTIPLSIEHGKLHLKGRVNGSEELDLLFDTGADIHVLYPSAVKKGARLVIDGTSLNDGSGGATVRGTSSANRIEVAGLEFGHETILSVEKQADRADGILGYTAFSDRVVQFDFVRRVLVLHDSLPALPPRFTATPLALVGSLTAVEANLEGAGPGLFILDTGGTGTLGANAAYAAAHGLPGSFERLGTSSSRGVGSVTIRNVDVLLPQLVIAGHALRDVPLIVEEPNAASASAPYGKLFMDVLGRFDLVVDYPRGLAYFAPNDDFEEPFARGGGPPTWAIAVLAALAVAAIAGLARIRRRRRAD